MPAEWLKYGADLPDKPEIAVISELTGLDRFSVAGRLMSVWMWFSRNSEDGHVAFAQRNAPVALGAQQDGLTDSGRASVQRALLATIDRVAEQPGFASAMIKAGWLETTDHGVSVPKWDRHNSGSAKQRAQASRRIAKQRRNAAAESDEQVAHRAQQARNTDRNGRATRKDKKKKTTNGGGSRRPGGAGGNSAANSPRTREPLVLQEARQELATAGIQEAHELSAVEAVLRRCAQIRSDKSAQARLAEACEQLQLPQHECEELAAELSRRRAAEQRHEAQSPTSSPSASAADVKPGE